MDLNAPIGLTHKMEFPILVESAGAHVWSQSPQQLELSTKCVHIWRLRLEEPLFGTTQAVLASDEQARASRFHFERDRNRYVRCRAALRELLALYLHMIPAHIKFTYSTSGKPEIAEDQNPHKLRFNVSHSEDQALIAVCRQDNIGIDVERIRNIDVNEMTRRFFSHRECASLQSLPAILHTEAFYACWTRKEAFLKASGEGLRFPLSEFSVSVQPAMQPRIEEIRGDEGAASRWSLADLHVGDGFRAAFALERATANVLTFSLFT